MSQCDVCLSDDNDGVTCAECLEDANWISISRAAALEAASALALRSRWYETRGYDTPPQVRDALRAVCKALGVDPTTL